MTLISRDLLFQTVQSLHELPDIVEILFEDGVAIQSSKRKLIYSWYFWEFHRQYPKTPLLSTHHVNHVLKGKSLTSDTHRLLISVIYEQVIKTYNLYAANQTEHALQLCYQITNRVYNEISSMTEEYVNTIDLLDFIEVIEHPKILNITQAITTDKENIAQAYKAVLNTIKTEASLGNNNLVQAVRAGMVNANQVNQCIVTRGYMTEVDGTVLPTPVMANYTTGMNTLYQYIAESRSAAKSYFFSESPLEDSEYFARRLQLLCMTVERLHHEDCGSQKYIDWMVKPPSYNERNEKVYPGDLTFMTGKNYLDETTGQLKTIKGDDPDLYNKVLKIRSPLTCQHPDKHGICAVCYGELSRNVPTYANLGHLNAATMTQQTTQAVMSTKHYDGSAIAVFILMSPILAPYFKLDKLKTSLMVKEEFKKNNVRIVIARDEALGLLNAMNSVSLANINPNRVSSIQTVEFIHNDGKSDHSTYIDVTQNDRCLVLSKELLEYIKMYKWKTDAKNNFIIDLSAWDFSHPLLKLPEMEYSYSDHSNQVARVVESSLKNLSDRAKPESPVKTLQEIFDLVNSKLWVNFAVLEVIVYAIMNKNPNSFDLARHSEEPVLGVASSIIQNRSLSAAYGYESVINTLLSPRSFFKLDRPDSVFDVMICPAEVTKHYKELYPR